MSVKGQGIFLDNTGLEEVVTNYHSQWLWLIKCPSILAIETRNHLSPRLMGCAGVKWESSLWRRPESLS